MKSAMRMRYYCDHCGKSGGSSFHMKKHEAACTMNQNRVCKMCRPGMLQATMPELLAAMRRDAIRHDSILSTNSPFDLSPVEITELAAAANGCPACILAAIRQSDVYVQFDYKDAVERFWEEHAGDEAEQRPAVSVLLSSPHDY